MAEARVLIQHLGGSKINQIEQLPLEGLMEITIGRDPASTISFDAQRDDAVSRRHAIIIVVPGEKPGFRIADLGSRNGTLLNGERIAAEVELLPEDVIELGKGGPKFKFDVQPRPANMIGRTRHIATGVSGITPQTRIIDTGDIVFPTGGGVEPPPPPKASVGRETVERLLTERSHQTNKSWMYVLAGAMALVAVGGGALYHYNKVKTDQAKADAAAAIVQQNKQMEEKIAADKATQEQNLAAVRHDMGVPPDEIVRKYGNATVVIDVQWRLYDKISGKPLYQMVRAMPGDGKVRLPCFVRLANGKVVRWLTTDDQNQTNQWIGAAGHGSGFVIDAQGFILTNKHVASGWLIPYGQLDPVGPALIYNIGDNQLHVPPVDLGKEPELASIRKELNGWQPGDPQSDDSGGIVFRANAPIPVDDQFHDFEGRNDVLDVRFPGSLVSVSAHFLRANPQADVAEIKIDTQQALTTVELAPDDDVKVGESVTVLGYPAFSTQTIAIIQSAEAGRLQNKAEEVPEPTVTAGLVSQKSQGVQNQGSGVTTMGMLGDVYQLTVPTSAGNSGGPVFNSQGKVIGLFTYGDPKRETTTYAVPIARGRSLSQVQRSAN